LQQRSEDEDREASTSAALTAEIGRLRVAHDQLRERLLELEAELEARTRRLHQLIGERDQLASLMRGRDQQIQQLNRELGARQPTPRGSGSGSLLGTLRSTVGGLSRGTRQALRWRQPAPAAVPTAAPAGRHPLVPWVEAGPPRPILCAVVAGLPSAAIEGVLETVARQCQARRMIPMLLTSDDAFEIFRGQRMVVEFLPAAATLQAALPDRPAELYLQRRLALIRRKWQPQRVVAFGPAAAELVALWQASPFEDEPVPAASGAAAPA
jgi:hypothetical protein